jgi:hypothetical protein
MAKKLPLNLRDFDKRLASSQAERKDENRFGRIFVHFEY